MITSDFMSLLLSHLKRTSTNTTFSRQRQSIPVIIYNAMFEYCSNGFRITRVLAFSIDPRIMENRFDLHKNSE